jgi:hypothetical protein
LRAAPAPFPTPVKQLPKPPEEVRRVLWSLTEGTRQNIKTLKDDYRRATTEEGRKRCAWNIALLEKEIYTEPVVYLEIAIRLPKFHSAKDQAAIKAQLGKYRERYQEAKKKGLVK